MTEDELFKTLKGLTPESRRFLVEAPSEEQIKEKCPECKGSGWVEHVRDCGQEWSLCTKCTPIIEKIQGRRPFTALTVRALTVHDENKSATPLLVIEIDSLNGQVELTYASARALRDAVDDFLAAFSYDEEDA